jgi:hypothetical protein
MRSLEESLLTLQDAVEMSLEACYSSPVEYYQRIFQKFQKASYSAKDIERLVKGLWKHYACEGFSHKIGVVLSASINALPVESELQIELDFPMDNILYLCGEPSTNIDKMHKPVFSDESDEEWERRNQDMMGIYRQGNVMCYRNDVELPLRILYDRHPSQKSHSVTIWGSVGTDFSRFMNSSNITLHGDCQSLGPVEGGKMEVYGNVGQLYDSGLAQIIVHGEIRMISGVDVPERHGYGPGSIKADDAIAYVSPDVCSRLYQAGHFMDHKSDTSEIKRFNLGLFGGKLI